MISKLSEETFLMPVLDGIERYFLFRHLTSEGASTLHLTVYSGTALCG